MAVNRTYKCSECGGQFVVRQAWDDPPPRFCMICGFDFETLEVPLAPELPRVNIGGSTMAKSVEQTYRELETSPAKISDLNDGLRAGDVAAKPVNNIVTQTMEAMQREFDATPWQGANVQGVVSGKQPPKNSSGREILSTIQSRNMK